MRKKNNSTRKMKFAQSCDSKECRKNHKDEIIKDFSETVTTAHEYDGKNKTVTCLECGKVTKLK